MGTLEKIRLDADRFVRQYGLENEYSLKIMDLAEQAENWFDDEKQVNPVMELLWNGIYTNYEILVKVAK